MSKITKKQKKLQELLADFEQPASGRDALIKLQEVSKEDARNAGRFCTTFYSS